MATGAIVYGFLTVAGWFSAAFALREGRNGLAYACIAGAMVATVMCVMHASGQR